MMYQSLLKMIIHAMCGLVNGYFGFTEGSISTFTKINIENVKSVVTAGSEATFYNK